MKCFQTVWVLLLLGSVRGQYNYQQHNDNPAGYQYQQPQPAPTYLPPTSKSPPVTKSPYESETDVAAEGQGPPADDQDHAPGMPYDFTYAVKDDYGNDFAHKADSDGEVVKGEYRTLLPDGRMQIVKYTADWKNGFNADVSYEGQASYPEEKPASRRPYVPPPATRAPFFPPTNRPNDEFEEDVDSQGLYPSKGSQTPPPPFRCYPGSTDYRCPQPTTQPPFRCYPDSTDPRCAPRCYPGSTDPRCSEPTTNRPVCYPGSTDTRCPQSITTQPPQRCYPGSPDQRCQAPPTHAPRCYPGSFDPRCPTEGTTPEPPTLPPGLYGAPSLPFGVRNNPKFGYNNK